MSLKRIVREPSIQSPALLPEAAASVLRRSDFMAGAFSTWKRANAPRSGDMPAKDRYYAFMQVKLLTGKELSIPTSGP